ncbi:MAG: SixA phosphatase family protein [Chthoniobacterales bacterium]
MNGLRAHTRSDTAKVVQCAFLLVAISLLSCGAAHAQIFIVRHAEKAQASPEDPGNPPLSEAGRRRAEGLAQVLRDAGVTSVYATEFQRTQQTAQPTAEAAQVKVAVIAANDSEALVQQLRAGSGPALVVGHSNTIPALLKALGVKEEIALGDADYDNLFVVLTEPEPHLLRLHYCP